MSYAGLTRVSIDLCKKNFQKKVDCREREGKFIRVDAMPGNEGCGIYAALAGGSASTE